MSMLYLPGVGGHHSVGWGKGWHRFGWRRKSRAGRKREISLKGAGPMSGPV